MKSIPSIPTDNLYKTIAISGLTLVLIFIVFLIRIIYLQQEIEINDSNAQSYAHSKLIASDIESRLQSIEKNELDKHKVPATPRFSSVQQEKEFLLKALANHNEIINKYKNAANNNMEIASKLQIYKRPDIKFAGAAYILLMVILTMYGFSRWVWKIQQPDDEIKKLEIIIKQKTIEKLELEINQLKKKRSFGNMGNKHH